MIRRTRKFATVLALVTAAAFSVRAPGDSLTTMDGRVLNGRIDKTETGYTVHTAAGAVNVLDANVKHVMLDHAADRTGKKKPVDPKTVETLQKQGNAAYAAGAFNVARDLFIDASHVDPGNPLTARGLGMAYLRLERPNLAVEPLEQAYHALPNDRELLIVMSTALVESKNPMRAVKFIKLYMEKTPATVDEDCLNALGAALSQADGIAVKQTLYTQAYALYLKDNAKLEAMRPGEKRWGSIWMPAEDVKAKIADRHKAEKAVATAEPKIPAIQGRIEAAQRQMSQYAGTLGDNNRSRMYDAGKADLATAEKEMNAAEKELADAQAALAATEQPTFPLLVTLDSAGSEEQIATSQPTTPPTDGTTTKPDGDPTAIADGTPKPTPDAMPVVPPEPTTKPSTIARAVTPNKAPEVPNGPVTQYGAAFAIAPDLVVCPASIIAGSKSIRVDVAVGPSFDAAVVRADAAAGLVLIRVQGANFTPMKIADRVADKPTTCLGFPSVDIFNPIVETISVSRSASGAADHSHFSMPPRIPGAPLLQDKSVVGMELAGRDTDPSEVPVMSADTLRKFIANDEAPGNANGRDSVVQVITER